MKSKLFGMMAAGMVTGLVSSAALSADKAPAAGKAAPAAAGKCVNSCKGHAACKGNGSATCKGHNECAGQGQAPKECAAKKKDTDCATVKAKDGSGMCEWKV